VLFSVACCTLVPVSEQLFSILVGLHHSINYTTRTIYYVFVSASSSLHIQKSLQSPVGSNHPSLQSSRHHHITQTLTCTCTYTTLLCISLAHTQHALFIMYMCLLPPPYISRSHSNHPCDATQQRLGPEEAPCPCADRYV